MNRRGHAAALLCLFSALFASHRIRAAETLPPLAGAAPDSFEKMWAGFDPRDEPLELETLLEWEEESVVLRIVRFRIGVFKGRTARLAAVYGFPKSVLGGAEKISGLVQIHGGGQYADYRACLTNAQRGYATVSIAWAGRISAPQYRVSPNEVKLFWENKSDDPAYQLTTDWGAVDAYHAPSRNPGNVFPSAKTAAWTLDSVESPRNSGWFLAAIAARRALTFLERQPEVDPNRLGVYGHSMGGKLTVMTAVDPRVKAAAPSCGGISDRYNSSPLFRKTIGDDVSLRQIKCPIIFLSPANDFHGRIGDLPAAIDEIQARDWRVTCSPHHNHQDTPAFEVATQLWFDHHLQHRYEFPSTPETAQKLQSSDGVPQIEIRTNQDRIPLSVEVYYTQQGKSKETPFDRIQTMHRYWRYVKPQRRDDGSWLAKLPLSTLEHPLWVYANIRYGLNETVRGAGYYYGDYMASSVNVSSLMQVATPDQLQAARAKSTLQRSQLIEDFEGDWEKSWFRYRIAEWPMFTHKLYDKSWRAPEGATLALEVRSDQANSLVILLDNHAAVTKLAPREWSEVRLKPEDFKDFGGQGLPDWNAVRRLKLGAVERLRSTERGSRETRVVGKPWNGPPPEFRNLRWITESN